MMSFCQKVMCFEGFLKGVFRVQDGFWLGFLDLIRVIRSDHQMISGSSTIIRGHHGIITGVITAVTALIIKDHQINRSSSTATQLHQRDNRTGHQSAGSRTSLTNLSPGAELKG